jgi:hypothetical protein
MKLLKNPADPGYPVDYLLSRIKGRRSRLTRDWRPLLFGPTPQEAQLSSASDSARKSRTSDSAWRDLMKEHQWVYSRMSMRLRSIFAPYFLYAELGTICICLRHLANGRPIAISELLDRSLLSDDVAEALTSGTDLPATVREVERLFSGQFRGSAGLEEALEAGGLRRVEQRLVEAFLGATIGSGLHPIMRAFFSRIIDARNIMALYKYLRFELKSRPSFIPGGGLPEKGLNEIAARDDLPALAALVREFTGSIVERPDPTSIEIALYRGMTRWLRKEGREPFGVAPLLEYLWRCSIEAMNMSVLYHTKDLEREAVTAELVQ